MPDEPMLSLPPPVEGRRVLDAGCGPGAYAERLVGRGAEVGPTANDSRNDGPDCLARAT
jgi:2-polyprenyl-3-methyl-5-hydroxy-6-metoxy-1,4-benzoquinol methylase